MDMRSIINLFESTKMKQFVGTCVNSFDEDGDCIVSDLPWQHVSDLGYADENATDISETDFASAAQIPQGILNKIKRHHIRYMLSDDGVFMIYDDDKDIHYFFV